MEELKAETQSESNAQEEKEETTTEEETPEENSEVEEDFDSLPEWAQEKFKKVEEDRNNYRSGLLKYKSEARSLRADKPEEKEEEEEEDEWDETSKRFKEETISEAEKRAEQAAVKVYEQEREKTAIEKFHDKHPELSDDALWSKLVKEYKSESGRGSIKGIVSDLDSAYDKAFGKQDQESFDKGKQKGLTDSKLADAHTISYTKKVSKPKQVSKEDEISDRLSKNMPTGYKT